MAPVSAPSAVPAGACRHRSDLPEVTFCAPAIAGRVPGPAAWAMDAVRRTILDPLHLAALLTIGAVSLSLRAYAPEQRPAAAALLAAFAAGFLLLGLLPPRAQRWGHALLVALPALALALIALDPRPGAAPVLLVVWTAAAFADWPPRTAALAVAAADVGYYLILRFVGGFDAPLMPVLIFAGFQAFAALCMHYARSAERARDQLARVNADLLATRALLADSARDAERLRVARELHDVAGHTLTALRLNLRALAADPAFAAREEIAIAERLSGELLGDLRGIVQALRDDRGLDLETALRALAAPLPRPALRLEIGDDVRVTDPAVAEALLRLVQEALTNAARHADARTLDVRLHREGARLHLAIQDDGRLREGWREGNGIAGMRERLAALHGELRLGRGEGGGMRIVASLPA
ncbi:histidine kinase [Luteimonas sp. Y-2-2-4F]|nr:histidine kinase [Luteimonas sp. Y-2-2-4F]MCD9031958.1 histidine kinase [Luteimonas sp. Y-2-2-4F]